MFTVAGVASPDAKFINTFHEGTLTADVWTWLIDTATAATTYSIVYEGFTYSYYNTSETVAADLAADILADMNINAPEILSLATVTRSSATLSLTSKRKGVSRTLTTGDSNVTLTHSTTGAESGSCYIGRLAYISEWDTILGGVQRCNVTELNASTLVAGIYDWTRTYVSGAADNVSFEVDGVFYSVNVIHNTDTATTVAAAAALINAMMPANTVDASVVSSKVRLTAEVKGLTINNLSVSAGSVAAVTTTQDSIHSLFNSSTAPVRGGNLSLVIPVRGDNDTADYFGVRKAFRSWFPTPGTWCTVPTQGTITSGSKVFYHTTGTHVGKYSSTKASTNVYLPGFTFGHTNSSANVAALVKQ